MHLTATQILELLLRLCRNRIGYRTDRKCDQKLVGMKSGVFASQGFHLQIGDRLQNFRRDQIDAVINISKCFQCVEIYFVQ